MQDRTVKVKNAKGNNTRTEVVLPGSHFDRPKNVPLIHQVVEAQRAAARQGTAATKTRAMVSGGGKKPFRQKGTGNARQGSIRAPHFTGGGVVHGPQPRDYAQRTPKKMKAGALRSALSDRARHDHVHVVSEIVAGKVPSTKSAKAALSALVGDRLALIVLTRDEVVPALSFQNLQEAQVLWADQLNTYDVMVNDDVIFSVAALGDFLGESVEEAEGEEEL
jgi:50S ribosomal protein L4, bacterial/organelle